MIVADVGKISQAADLIEAGWTQGCYARNARGEMTSSQFNPEAASYSADGALKAITGRVFTQERRLIEQAIGMDLKDWNDTDGRTQDEVVRAFRMTAQFHQGVAA